jgi:hypothetical protein
MDLRETGWGGVDWIYLAEGRDQWRTLVNTVMDIRVPQYVGKFFSGCTIGSTKYKDYSLVRCDAI